MSIRCEEKERDKNGWLLAQSRGRHDEKGRGALESRRAWLEREAGWTKRGRSRKAEQLVFCGARSNFTLALLLLLGPGPC